MFKITNGLAPSYLSEMFTFSTDLNDYNLRSSKMNLELRKNRTNYYKNCFAFSGVKIWNARSSFLMEETSLERFKAKIKLHTVSYL